MRNHRTKPEELRIYMTAEQKNQLRRLAVISKKNMSEFALDAALNSTLDTAKSEFYQSINTDLNDLKRGQYITNRLLLLVGQEQLQSHEKIMEFYQETKEKAEEKYGKERDHQ